VAFLQASIDLGTRMLSYANAGQTKPLLHRAGEVRWLEVDGVHFPLGAQPETCYQESALQLARNDVLCFLTDGFTEAMNGSREVFGAERVEELFRRPELPTLAATDILNMMVREVRQYTGDAPQHDDMTMVIVKVL